ncbi:hypothetical protein R1flu_018892 [Riccia fluitans]|uniref:Ribosomal protein S14 n=1 Tax=Riccia fluitans TaxID=41844 RepID=A0ABD1ZL11_9MARC
MARKVQHASQNVCEEEGTTKQPARNGRLTKAYGSVKDEARANVLECSRTELLFKSVKWQAERVIRERHPCERSVNKLGKQRERFFLPRRNRKTGRIYFKTKGEMYIRNHTASSGCHSAARVQCASSA